MMTTIIMVSQTHFKKIARFNLFENHTSQKYCKTVFVLII